MSQPNVDLVLQRHWVIAHVHNGYTRINTAVFKTWITRKEMRSWRRTLYSDVIRLLMLARKQQHRASPGTSCELAPSEGNEYKGNKFAWSMNARSPRDHKTKKLKLRGLSPELLTNVRRLSAKLVPTFADRGCRVVSATIPKAVLSDF
jgi:hypothetical protein